MKTRIYNSSGADKFFGFIPPHGKLVESNASVLLDGDLRTVLAGGRGRYGRKAELASAQTELDAGNLFLQEVEGNEGSSSSSPSA